LSKIGPELDLLLNALLFRLSLWQMNTTYGNQLQNLIYEELTPQQKLLFFFFTSGMKSTTISGMFNYTNQMIFFTHVDLL
jgi:hypothetical protein